MKKRKVKERKGASLSHADSRGYRSASILLFIGGSFLVKCLAARKQENQERKHFVNLWKIWSAESEREAQKDRKTKWEQERYLRFHYFSSVPVKCKEK